MRLQSSSGSFFWTPLNLEWSIAFAEKLVEEGRELRRAEEELSVRDSACGTRFTVLCLVCFGFLVCFFCFVLSAAHLRRLLV